MNIKKNRYTKEEIQKLEIGKEADNYPFKWYSKDKRIEVRFFGKSISFKWWF